MEAQNEAGYSYEINSHVFTPETVNMGEMSMYSNGDAIRVFVHDPMHYHNELCDICESLYNANGVLTEVITKMVAAPTFDFIAIPIGGCVESKDKAEDTAKSLAIPLFTRDALRNYLLYGEYVMILQEQKVHGEVKKMLKPLHHKYVRFDGTTEGDHIVSFDLSYFEEEAIYCECNAADLLRTFPDYFYKGYLVYLKDRSKRWIALPRKTTFAVKHRADMLERHGRPLALAGLDDMIFSTEYLSSQRNQLRQNCSELVIMEHPQGREAGSCALNKTQQDAQYDAFKGAVQKRSNKGRFNSMEVTTMSVAPGTGIKRLEVNTHLLKETLKEENNEQIAADLGMGLGAVSGKGGQGNYASLKLNMDLVLAECYQFAERAQEQYGKILNYCLNTGEDNAVEFIFLKTSTINRKEAFATAKEMYATAGGSRTWLYATGTGDSRAYLKLMEYEKAQGYDKKYPPHVTSYTTANNKDGKDGAPVKDDGDLSQKGLETRTHGGNEGDKPGV